MSAILLNVALIATNLLYLLPSVAAWQRRMHSLMPWFLAVMIVSALHHACNDAGLCSPGLEGVNFSTLDVLLSTQASIIIFLVPMNYDLVKVKMPPQALKRRASLRLVKHLDASYMLVEHTYGRVFEAIMTIVTIATNVLLPGTFWAMIVPLAVATPIVLGTLFVYLPMKRRTSKQRIHVPLAIAAGLVGAAGVTLFALEELGVLGRYVHPVWHALTAVASWLWILAMTKHLRVDSLTETLLFCRQPSNSEPPL